MGVHPIKSLCKDKYGGVWVGTFKKGLWYRPPHSDRFKVFPEGSEDGAHVSSPNIYALNAVDSGVWIGTSTMGINFYHFNSKEIRFCFQDSSQRNEISNVKVLSMMPDSKSNLWIGTLNGLFKVHLPTGKAERIEQTNSSGGFSNNAIFCIWEDHSGDIWIGTKNRGAMIYHPETKLFETFSANGLLEGRDVYGIIEDQNGNLWISSNNGLIMYNRQANVSRHFDYSDGIQSNLFSIQSIYKDAIGDLYFGGTNGFTKIDPGNIKKNERKPRAVINQITTKNNQTIFPVNSSDHSPQQINLGPNESIFRINFFADNYLMPEKNKYKYRLVNYYDDWIDMQNNASVLFTSLDAGDYTFEVLACNNDGIWSETPTRLNIEIKNYWYKTTLAYFLYFSLLSVVIYLIGGFYFERLKLKKAVLVEKNQRENEEQIHEMKLKFFTNISHEFRTPLTLITWPLKRLINAKNLTKEQRDELNVVSRNSERLLKLINQLLDFRKLDRSKSNLKVSKVDIIELIRETQQVFESEVKAKKIEFIFEPSWSSLQIEADREKVSTILFNLLSNACKYISPGGKISILINKTGNSKEKSFSNQFSLGQIDCKDFVEIAVEDSGIGIDYDDLTHIFNRFEQAKKNGHMLQKNIKGSGIGLSICKDFTVQHGGKIIAKSEVGKGTRITVLLPSKQNTRSLPFEIHDDSRNLKDKQNSFAKLNTEEKPDNLYQILVVEDNSDFRKLIYQFLKRYFQVECAKNGKDALEVLKERHIDLVVSDVMMPEMDGFELCKIVKTNIETSHIPIVLLTALSTSDKHIMGLDLGADAYITKPFEEVVLLKQIENILQQRRRLQDNFKKQFVSQKGFELGGLDNFFLKRVQAVVEDNINQENFGMDTLAKELLISRSQLHRKIKSLSGTSTSEFVNLVRINNAVKLIENGNHTYGDVAFHVGFNSQSYFIRCFKKIYGKTPKDYFSNQHSISHKLSSAASKIH